MYFVPKNIGNVNAVHDALIKKSRIECQVYKIGHFSIILSV